MPRPPPGDLPDPGVQLASPALAGVFCPTEPLGKSNAIYRCITNENLLYGSGNTAELCDDLSGKETPKEGGYIYTER